MIEYGLIIAVTRNYDCINSMMMIHTTIPLFVLNMVIHDNNDDVGDRSSNDGNQDGDVSSIRSTGRYPF
jgi:hypothetical protein